MKILKYSYRILYFLLAVGLTGAVTQGILQVFHDNGVFQLFDTMPCYGAEAYCSAAFIYAFFYSITVSIPLIIAVILHLIDHIIMEHRKKSENKIRIPAGDES
ncbi:MAG: hypothetical protein IJ642_00225 [Oscillospiraceae bacterium]|nr:hypothetical protein [Oscillospiraceae bacterium]